MLCPECKAPLEAAGGNQVRCSAHGGVFEVLYARPETFGRSARSLPPPPPPAETPPRAEAPAPGGGEPAVDDKIVAACPVCEKHYRVSRASLGQQARCKCGVLFTVEDANALYEFKDEDGADEAYGAGDHTCQCGARYATGATYCRACGAVLARSGRCAQHPDVDAGAACVRCHALVCDTCSFPGPDGAILCPRCVSAPVSGALPPAATTFLTPLADGAHCIQHVDTPAVVRCTKCREALCGTCAFEFPGRVFLCPTCACTPRTGVTGRRRVYAIWSIVLAAWGSLGTALVFAGLFAEVAETDVEAEAFGIFLMLVVVLPLVIGLGLGVSSFERGVKGQVLAWVGTIWNGLLVGTWLLLMVVGIFMG